MQLQQRINAFVALGQFLGQFSEPFDRDEITEVPLEELEIQEAIPYFDIFYDGMLQQLELAHIRNKWFVSENLSFACKSWSEALSEENIKKWVSKYSFSEVEENPKTVAVIMAGNIPLVGFHDFLSVLISGHKVLAKLSSKDKELLPYLAKYLIAVEPGFEDYISFTEEKLENFDAVIATGSSNSARYFDYYFSRYPHIIRKNRNSIAVLTGNESPGQLEALANDIFMYFGLGCRNVSKIFIPEGYSMDAFFNGMYSHKEIIHNHKYINNYDYNKAVYLMSGFHILDNEFLMLKEDTGFSSPISVVFYEYYKDHGELAKKLSEEEEEKIQAIVSDSGIKNEISFGKAQYPALWDYADGVDTLKFLTEL